MKQEAISGRDIAYESNGMEKAILVVDGDSTYQRRVMRLIHTLGYVPVEAASAEEALNAALTNAPHMIVCAAQLPVMNGIEFIIRLKLNPKTSSIPVVIYMENLTSRDGALKAGASLVVKRTSSLRNLRLAIQNTVGGLA